MAVNWNEVGPRLLHCLKWYVENDDVIDGDGVAEWHTGATWSEVNEFWISGRDLAIKAIEEVERGTTD